MEVRICLRKDSGLTKRRRQRWLCKNGVHMHCGHVGIRGGGALSEGLLFCITRLESQKGPITRTKRESRDVALL